MWGGGEFELRIINYELRIMGAEGIVRNFLLKHFVQLY